MTEDTSPENLRKFLESDDPAMRMMGLSMAKGTGSLDKAIIGLHFWDPEEENQKAAGELIKAIGIEKFEEFPGWLEPFDYSKLEKTFGFRLCNHLATSVERIISFADERSTELISECVDYLVKALGIHTRIAQNALTEIGEPAIPNLIKNIRNRKMEISDSCIEILGNIGDSRALNPLLKILELKKESKRRKAFEALENLSKNIEIPLNIKERMAKKIIIWLDEEGWRSTYTYIPFFKEIEMENEDLVVNLLDKSLEDKDMTSGKRKAIISILKKIGGERVVSVLIKNLHKKEAFRDIKYDIRYADYDNAIPKVPTCTDKIFVLVKGGKNSLYGAKYNGKNPKSWMGGDKKYYVSHPVGMAKRDLAFYGYKSVWSKHVAIHVSNSIIKEKDLIFSLSEEELLEIMKKEDRIVFLEDVEDCKFVKNMPTFPYHKFESSSTAGKLYHTTVNYDELSGKAKDYWCSCPDFIDSVHNIRTCKHTKEAKIKIEKERPKRVEYAYRINTYKSANEPEEMPWNIEWPRKP